MHVLLKSRFIVVFSDRFKVEKSEMKAFGDFHVGSRRFYHLFFFFVSFLYIFVNCNSKCMFYKNEPDSENF